MYYEYWNTLKDLNDFSKKFKEKIVVKLHPSVQSKPTDLKNYLKISLFQIQKLKIYWRMRQHY